MPEPAIPSTLVTLATYNERENLPRLIDEIQAALPAADILVVDDNSPDGTGQWCDERAASDARLKVIHRAGKLGLGTALIAGMEYAVAHGYTYLVTLDADFSHPPTVLPALVAGMEGAGTDGGGSKDPVDVMIGSRYVVGGRIEGWPLKRHVMSRGVNFFSRWVLGLPPRDCSGGFRCYRLSKLAEIDFGRLRSHGYSFLEELLYRLVQRGCRTGEVPIVFVDRQAGSSKISLSETVVSAGKLLRLAVERWLRF